MDEYWYFITIYRCPVCHWQREERERRHTKRPEKWGSRNKVIFLDEDECTKCFNNEN